MFNIIFFQMEDKVKELESKLVSAEAEKVTLSQVSVLILFFETLLDSSWNL